MDTGKRVREIRKKNKLTQVDFAEKMGVNQSYISKIEQNLLAPNLEFRNNLINKFGEKVELPEVIKEKRTKYGKWIFIPH